MDDFENERVRFIRSPFTLYEKRCARKVCPMCTKKVRPGQVYCGAGCSQRAECNEPLMPETEEEKKL